MSKFCVENQMLLRTDYRPDVDDALQRVDKVWGAAAVARTCVDTSVERILIHDSTKARAFAMWAARSTSLSATPLEMIAFALTTVLNAVNVEGRKQVVGEDGGVGACFGDCTV